ncbi:NitT/TauT family transport system permease protein [Halarchaeum solikamskense]|uniref:ABC transporter permease n=1 Tax=Halarchaeum nitratireducens TaxID=489913 RepID=UPI001B3ACD99|nr:ABC transporter permease [Halarchaeum solikamskense]MBP2249860.1 NitT/TauT family transport system permease protein [Halarchaeum solikamskense]
MDVDTRSLDASSVVDSLKSIYSLVLLLVLWEVVTRMGLIYPYFLPQLSVVIDEFVLLVSSGQMIHAAYLTLMRAFVGLAGAAVAGVVIGILCARNALFEWFFDPIIKIGYPVPVISLVPVFMLWFGIGDVSKIIMVVVGTFWPVAVNARDATRQVDRNLIRSARMMGTGDRRLLWRVILPAASPGIFTGLQIATPIALIITFVFEMVAGGGGLGALEIAGVRGFNSAQTYAVIFAIIAIGLVLDRLLRAARTRLLDWT